MTPSFGACRWKARICLLLRSQDIERPRVVIETSITGSSATTTSSYRLGLPLKIFGRISPPPIEFEEMACHGLQIFEYRVPNLFPSAFASRGGERGPRGSPGAPIGAQTEGGAQMEPQREGPNRPERPPTLQEVGTSAQHQHFLEVSAAAHCPRGPEGRRRRLVPLRLCVTRGYISVTTPPSLSLGKPGMLCYFGARVEWTRMCRSVDGLHQMGLSSSPTPTLARRRVTLRLPR